MSKRSYVTNITPLPLTITRPVALAYLHDHNEMISLNPLVIRHQTTKAPPNATLEEEVNCKWYEITDRINYLPGGVAKGEVSYKAGFYDLDHGLQTHVFAPAGVDIKALWKVGGSAPGEPLEPAELGVDTPKSGLYLREDVELKCSVFLMGFVKRNLKKSHAKLVEDLFAKANDPRYLKTRSASQTSTVQQSRSPGAGSFASSDRSRVLSFPPSLKPGHSSQSSHIAMPVEEEEPCLCTGSQHQVMCHKYRYTPASPYQSHPSEPTAPSELASDVLSPADIYCPATTSPPGGYTPYNRVLPSRAPASELPGSSTPQQSGGQAELPATTTSPVHDERRHQAIGGGEASELDGAEVAYWRQWRDAVEMQ